jgi:CRISPR-associated endonuclease Csn1
MSKKILGLDLGSNSIGWALLEADDGKPNKIINLGSRIFTKAVEEKTPTPKNVKRRNARLTRRVLQRRARRKAKMLNCLIQLDLLPLELKNNPTPELILNTLGNPYQLRARALDYPLTAYELGRVMLYLVQRRGFLSNKKTLLGDMVDDPDVLAVLAEEDEKSDTSTERGKEESAFKADIKQLKNTINESGFRTLGEYLASLKHHDCKRNRATDGGHLRTDRQMYQDELTFIWQQQSQHHPVLTDKVKKEIEQIIFYQRPLKLKAERIGTCSLEKDKYRAKIARLECQRFRYLQDINHLQYFDPYQDKYVAINAEDKQKLTQLFETTETVSFPAIRKELGLSKHNEFNLEIGNKKLKGNITACEIRKKFPTWDNLPDVQQQALVEDLLTITKKSVLKNRLTTHWGLDNSTAVQLCLLEFEPGHGSLSLKAIRKLLPYLEQGQIYSDARVHAGYGYEIQEIEIKYKLGTPPELPNPIVSKGLHELRRLVNAIIAEYGKPDAIRIEMARDLEMNTKKYDNFIKQQKANTKANAEAEEKYKEQVTLSPHLMLSKYPSKTDKIKYRLWQDQRKCCAYSGKPISLAELFSATVEIDHIWPYSLSLDDSYMNKVVCYVKDNRNKGQRTPIDAFSGNSEQWNQITQAIGRWDKSLKSKRDRFFTHTADLQQRDFISSQLNDTRYISKVAQDYLKQLGADISVSKGTTTAWLRHIWGLNDLLGETDKKERTDHRHHAIDAVVIACVDRRLYTALVKTAQDLEKKQTGLNMKDMVVDAPWLNLREDLKARLDDIIVAHAPQLKLIGELHEATGVGFVQMTRDGKRFGINVQRVALNSSFKATWVKDIVDNNVELIVSEHLSNFDNDPKLAFSEDNIKKLVHKDGLTPIKRVRVLQSKTTLAKLEKTKFGARDKQGKVFKWLAYGNMHHVEIIKHKQTEAVSGQFVTMMEAHRRAMTGTKSAAKRGVDRENIIKTDHGADYEFVMALHINDLVSVKKAEQRIFYRVQKLDSGSNRFVLRLHTTTKLDNKNEEIYLSINESSFTNWSFKKHKINAIGKLVE